MFYVINKIIDLIIPDVCQNYELTTCSIQGFLNRDRIYSDAFGVTRSALRFAYP
jgi:hypothetical protein